MYLLPRKQRWGLESLDSDSSRTRVPILLDSDSDSSPSHLDSDSDSRHADSDSTRTVGTRPDSTNCTDKNRFQATQPLKSYSNVENSKAKFRKRRDAYGYCLVFTRNRYVTCQKNIKTFRHFLTLASCNNESLGCDVKHVSPVSTFSIPHLSVCRLFYLVLLRSLSLSFSLSPSLPLSHSIFRYCSFCAINPFSLTINN